MQTQIEPQILRTARGQEAERILRTCVHCGFCNATCPTYQLLGDELDGPRGRIYLIKQMLEGQPVTGHTQLHLDRCLTCRNCETTCPSGVEYGNLLEIGRELVEERVPRPWHQRLVRKALRVALPHPRRFARLVGAARLLRPFMPQQLRAVIPAKRPGKQRGHSVHRRTVLMLDGCVQPALAPEINEAAQNVLERMGITAVRPASAGCCGALSLHLAANDEACDYMRRNIDAWWPHIEAGAEAIVITASGCGVTVKEYGHVLQNDPDYGPKAARISELACDVGEYIATRAPEELEITGDKPTRIAFHAPCTLQHGMKLGGVTEQLLTKTGFELTPVPDSHLCCGSAGTYSVLQKKLSQRLSANKIAALESGEPELIATANIGCLLELRKRAKVPVIHWIQLFSG